MIVATSGHIDHGKTLLVRTLTGIDTDRLPEEKARGISIDLGFAHAAVEGASLSFVDVPGHERFIRNMLAGVFAIDAALLVVAADDGVMPQTLEHVHILDLLGIDHGIAAITKADRVPQDRIDAVREEVRALLSTTRLKSYSILAVSALTGLGLPQLRQSLAGLCAGVRGRAVQDHRFRLAIDRAFTIAGSGTVVTGTVFSGAVATGDKLVVSPRGTPVRVRGVQVHGKAVERAEAGQRCALNLSGADVGVVARGDWLLDPAVHAPTRRLDVRLTLLASEIEPLAHWTPVHVHLGTMNVLGRVALPVGGKLAPGESAHAQLVLEREIGALHGDRFVIRDQSARRTMGGGRVLDPFSPPRRRASTAARSAQLPVLERDDPEDILRGLIASAENGIDLARFGRAFNLTAEALARAQQAAGAVALGREHTILVSRAVHERLADKALAALRAFHAAQPQAAGMEVAALHRAVAATFPPEAFHVVMRELAERRTLVLANDTARLAVHDATSNPEDAKLWSVVQRALPAAAPFAPTIAELAGKLAIKEPQLRDFLHRKSHGGEVLRLTPDRFCLRSTLATLASKAHELAGASPGGQFTVAQFRDATGTTRALAVPILELLDKLGITQRIGDNRRAGKDFVPILGAGAATARGGT